MGHSITRWLMHHQPYWSVTEKINHKASTNTKYENYCLYELQPLHCSTSSCSSDSRRYFHASSQIWRCLQQRPCDVLRCPVSSQGTQTPLARLDRHLSRAVEDPPIRLIRSGLTETVRRMPRRLLCYVQIAVQIHAAGARDGERALGKVTHGHVPRGYVLKNSQSLATASLNDLPDGARCVQRRVNAPRTV